MTPKSGFSNFTHKNQLKDLLGNTDYWETQIIGLILSLIQMTWGETQKHAFLISPIGYTDAIGLRIKPPNPCLELP